METIINLLMIALICVFVIDISGAIDILKSSLKWLLTKGRMSGCDYRLKPFDCSLCTIWWCGLIYLFFTGAFTLKYIVVVCLLATFSGLIKNTILLVEDTITKIIQTIYSKFIDK